MWCAAADNARANNVARGRRAHNISAMHPPIYSLLRMQNQVNAADAIKNNFGCRLEHQNDVNDAMAVIKIRRGLRNCRGLDRAEAKLEQLATDLDASETHMKHLCKMANVCIKTGRWYASPDALRAALYRNPANRIGLKRAKDYPRVAGLLIDV